MRPSDWPERLARFFLDRMPKPFVWGQTDCCMSACYAIEAVTGKNPLEKSIGKYKTARGSIGHLIKKLKYRSIEELFRSMTGAVEIKSNFAQRGDIAIIEIAKLEQHIDTPFLHTVGVVNLNAREVMVKSEFGCFSIPLKSEAIINLWRYE